MDKAPWFIIFLFQVMKKNKKNSIIQTSVEYSIVTQFTSFVAIEKREKDEDFSQPHGPSIHELVDKENMDILAYMGWEQAETVEALEGKEREVHNLLVFLECKN